MTLQQAADAVYVLAIEGLPEHKADLDDILADPRSQRAQRARVAREVGGG